MSAEGGLQRQFYEMLMESQWWSAEQLRNYQRSQLGQLLRHAKQHVPFYENRLDAVVKSTGDIDWTRWGEIPIVKRHDMIERRGIMQARELPPGHGPTAVFETSGSSGLPIQFTVTAIGSLADNGLRLRVHQWQQLDWSRTLCNRMGDAAHATDWPEGEPTGPWGPPWDDEARRGGSWYVSRTLPSNRLFEIMQDHNCTYLIAGPNMAHINALDAERLGVDIRIDAILSQGNVVRASDREICKRVFGAKIIEHYSSKEAGQMAHPCPLGNMHVNSETCLFELLDESDLPVKVGEVGRVVVTPFFQTAQPLIRYEQGDRATLGAECACGRHGPILQSIQGRNVAIFRHPDGRAVAELMPESTTDLLQAEYWQLAQVGANDYELRFVPRTRSSLADEQKVVDLFRSTFFSDATLKLRSLPAIPLNAGGKLAEYVNEWS